MIFFYTLVKYLNLLLHKNCCILRPEYIPLHFEKLQLGKKMSRQEVRFQGEEKLIEEKNGKWGLNLKKGRKINKGKKLLKAINLSIKKTLQKKT